MYTTACSYAVHPVKNNHHSVIGLRLFYGAAAAAVVGEVEFEVAAVDTTAACWCCT
jgi:hypothetical protein